MPGRRWRASARQAAPYALLAATTLMAACTAATGPPTPAPRDLGPVQEVLRQHDGQPVLVQMPTLPAPPEGWPVLLFLHGWGERGTDIDRTRHANTPPGAYPSLPALHRRMAVVTPQMKQDWRLWDVVWVHAALDTALADLPVDRSHLMVTGLSVGGTATWEYLTRYPDEVTAAVSFAAAAPDSFVDPDARPLEFDADVALLDAAQRADESLAEARFLTIHCADDRFIPFDIAAEMPAALQALGNETAEIIPVDGCRHGSWPGFYLEERLVSEEPPRSLYDWLLSP